MIGPVSILSLAAVSAAEATSSGKRGLRQPAEWMVPTIILASTATGFFGVGYAMSYLFHGGGSSGLPIETPSPNYVTLATGCKQGSYQTTDLATSGTVFAPTCTACDSSWNQTTPGVTAFAAKKPDSVGAAKQKAICSLCKANYYWVSSACTSCGGSGDDEQFTMPGELLTASGDDQTKEKSCFLKCPTGDTGVSTIAAGTSCLCGDLTKKDKVIKCTQGVATKCAVHTTTGQGTCE